MDIVIRASCEQPLAFNKQTYPKGVRAKETILPPRSITVIEGLVHTDDHLVMITPFGVDNALHVGHAVCLVQSKTVHIPIVNLDPKPVELQDGVQIASFTALDESSLVSGGINAVLELEHPSAPSEPITIGDSLTSEEIDDLKRVLSRNLHAFSFNGQLGLSKLGDHKIELVPNAKPFAEPVRRHPKVHVDEANRQVDLMLKQGIIEDSASPWASEYVMVKKKTGDWRMCIDYRRLNSITKKNSYPLPNIEECLEELSGNIYFSKLDFASGYWQVPVEEKSREFTAFRTSGGLYQFKVMPFGLTNAPASFQKMINLMFCGLKGPNLQIFLDDVCLASTSWKEHLRLLEEVLRIIRINNLKLKGSKCVFGVSEVLFLGHKISRNGITQDPGKLRAFSELPAPTNVQEVRRVLGAFGYYRRFVYNFSAIAEPIIQLTKKDTAFTWGAEQEAAFRTLKRELLKNATLSHYSPSRPTMMKTDACKKGIAAMLLQLHNGDWKLVSCVSRRLSDAEANYSVTEMEGLAIVYAVQKFRAYLLGIPFTIVTDHCALCSLGKKLSQNARLRRWAIVLSEFDFSMVYRKGSLHCDVDCLSRAPVNNADDGFLDKILLVDAPSLPTPINPNEWQNEYDDEESRKFLEDASRDRNELRIIDGLIYRESRLYVPHILRLRILQENHNQGIAAHDGVKNTLYRMRHFWWPQMKREIEEYVRACPRCQLRKPKRRLPHGTMHQHHAEAPLEVWAFDHIGPWQATITNKRFVCIGIDVFTRFVFAKAVSDQSGASFAEYLMEVVGTFGIPQSILTDNSKAFDNALVRAIESEHGILHKFSAPRHSQGNAVAERAIQSLEEKLSLVQQEAGIDWEQAIPTAVLSINTRPSATTGFAPYELMFNRANMITCKSLRKETGPLLSAALTNEMRATAATSTSNAHAKSKPRYDSQHRPTMFDVGALVICKRSSRRSKLSNCYEGPFEVIGREKDIYSIKNQSNGKTITRHVSQLELFVPPIVDNHADGGLPRAGQ